KTTGEASGALIPLGLRIRHPSCSIQIVIDNHAPPSYCPMTVMILRINFKSGKPAYLQLVDQVKAAAATGVLRPGEALPSIRPLAEELRLNRNTVAKAYVELERMGVIETAPGKGCFVKDAHSPLRKDVRRRMLID